MLVSPVTHAHMLLVLGLTPAVIMMLVGGTPARTVAEILHSVETKR